MTRIMKPLAIAALSLAAMAALAQTATPEMAQVAHPTGYAKILGQTKDANGKIHLVTGPMIPYNDQFNPAAVCVTPAFDIFEYDPAQVGTGLVPIENPAYGCDTGNAGARFTFAANSGKNYNDMGCIPGNNGRLCRRAGWMFKVTTASLVQQATIITTCENYTEDMAKANDATAAGRGDITGSSWLITFGAPLAAGFYRAEIELGAGSGWTMPADGTGGYIVAHGDYDGVSTMTLGNCSAGAWGIKTLNPSLQQNDTEWSDQVTIDNTFGTSELRSRFNASYPACLNNRLGSIVCFLYEQPLPVTLAPTAFTVGLGAVASGDLTSLSADDANALKICKAFVPNFTSPRIRLDATFLSPYLTATSVQLDMKARMTTGGSFKVRGFLADTSGAGTFAYGAPNQVIADTSIALTFATYGSGPVATGTHIDTDADATTDGTIVARTEIQQTGFSAVAVPCAEWEYMSVTVTP